MAKERSKYNPANREDAYCYSLQDDLKMLQSLSLMADKKAIIKQANLMIQKLEQIKL